MKKTKKLLSSENCLDSKIKNATVLISGCIISALIGVSAPVNAGVPLDPSFIPESRIIERAEDNTSFRVRVTWAGNDDWNQCHSLLNSYRNRVTSGLFTQIFGENWQCWMSGQHNGSIVWTADITLGSVPIGNLFENIKWSLEEHFNRNDIRFVNY